MQVSTLFIIGNGFDLNHSLPTGYNIFYTCITHNKQGREFVRTIERIIEKSPHMFWKDFERNLWHITIDYILEDALQELDSYNRLFDYETMDKSHMVNYSFEQHIEPLFHLDDLVKTWIQSIECSEAIKKIGFERKFSSDSYFLNFNYTHTLQELYNISPSRIHHIHGDINDPIMGHGEFDEINTTYKMNNDNFEIGDYVNELMIMLENFYESSRKNTSLFLDEVSSFLSNRDVEIDFEEIHVLGHSLGEVDHVYFSAIAEWYPYATWIITYHEDAKSTIKQLKKLGISGARLITMEQYEKL